MPSKGSLLGILPFKGYFTAMSGLFFYAVFIMNLYIKCKGGSVGIFYLCFLKALKFLLSKRRSVELVHFVYRKNSPWVLRKLQNNFRTQGEYFSVSKCTSNRSSPCVSKNFKALRKRINKKYSITPFTLYI